MDAAGTVEVYSVDTSLADAVLCISNIERGHSQQVGSVRVFVMWRDALDPVDLHIEAVVHDLFPAGVLT